MFVRNFFKSKSVKQNRKDRRSSKLMKAACAGLLGAGMAGSADQAKADIVVESSFVGDFSNNFAGADILSVGTDGIIGSVINPDDFDYFRWNDLQPGTNFSLNVDTDFTSLTLLDSNNLSLGTANSGNSGNVSVTVPTDGTLIGNLQGFEGGAAYTVTVNNVSFVPEPGAGSLLSLGALGLLGRRRKSNNES